jgi:hypothetical protein
MPPAQGAAAKGGGQQKPSEQYVAELLQRLHDEEARHQVRAQKSVVLPMTLHLRISLRTLAAFSVF